MNTVIRTPAAARPGRAAPRLAHARVRGAVAAVPGAVLPAVRRAAGAGPCAAVPAGHLLRVRRDGAGPVRLRRAARAGPRRRPAAPPARAAAAGGGPAAGAAGARRRDDLYPVAAQLRQEATGAGGLTSGRATRSALNAAGTAPPGTMAMPTPAHTHCMTVANWLTVTACRSGTAAIDA
ncbi:hypothetical protein G6F22_016860 [Rhizopus arrhizus]|nr:hypothetical protein G6F22_016860 [Rhizopus arrhizus]